MSTKTTFKRVALIAVASLGLGVLTSVSANAANTAVTNGKVTSITLAKVTSSPAVGTAVDVNMGAATVVTAAGGAGNSSTSTYAGIITSYPTGGFSQVTASKTAAGTDTLITGEADGSNVVADNQVTLVSTANTAFGGNTVTASATVGVNKFSFTPSAAGVYSLTVWHDADADGVVDAVETQNSISITVAAAAGTGTAISNLTTAADCSVTANAKTSITVSKSAPGLVGALCVSLKDTNGQPLTGKAIDVTIAGPGLVSLVTNATTVGATQGTTRTASASASSMTGISNVAVAVNADGTSGTSTVTVSTGTTVLATASFSFFGAAKTITAEQKLKVASTSGGALGTNASAPAGTTVATTPAVILSVRDKDGILISDLSNTEIKATSSDVSVISESITPLVNASVSVGNTTANTYGVAVTSIAGASGKSATLTFKVLDSDGATLATSDAIRFTLGGSVASVALTLDKANYTIGAPAIATLTLRDSSGNVAKDGDHTTILTDANGLTSSLAVNKTLFGATTVQSIGGVATVSFNAPSVAGPWTLTGTTGTGPSTDKAKALTASATVSSSYDAAIASLISKINALSKLIAKIQKKLGVK